MKLHLSVVALFVGASVLAACENATVPAPQPAGADAAQTQAKNIQAWAGNWSGTWSGNCVASMTVSDVTDMGAVVVHNYGVCGDLQAGTSADNAAKIDGNKMMTSYLGFDIEYTMGEGVASGVMTRGGAQIATGRFSRN